MKPSLLKIAFIGLSSVFLGGCATKYQVKVDGLSSADRTAFSGGQTYQLISETPDVETTDLFFKEVARNLQPVLRKSGLIQAAEGTTPDLVIGVNAHLSDPMVETRSYSEPIYVRDHGYNHVIRIPVVNAEGDVVRFAYRRYWTGPSYHYAGSVDHDRQYTVYDKVLVLSARPYTEGSDEAEEIWNLKISLRDGSTDYRSALPYMLVAAQPYIGKRTEGEITITISEDEPDVADFSAMVGDG